MVAMRMVQGAVDQVIDMIAMRHRLVATPRPMLVIPVVAGARRGDRLVRSPCRIFQAVLIDMPFMRMMQVPLVQIIDMTVMTYRGMAAARAVAMWMVCMRRMIVLMVVALRAHLSS
jgi:hypothetical protein